MGCPSWTNQGRTFRVPPQDRRPTGTTASSGDKLWAAGNCRGNHLYSHMEARVVRNPNNVGNERFELPTPWSLTKSHTTCVISVTRDSPFYILSRCRWTGWYG